MESFSQQQQQYHNHQIEDTEDFLCKANTTYALFGRSNSGKTTWIKNFISSINDVISDCVIPDRLILVYTYFQPHYSEIIKSLKEKNPSVKIEIFDEFPVEKFQDKNFLTSENYKHQIILIDDIIITEQIAKILEKLIKIDCHHAKCTVTVFILFLYSYCTSFIAIILY